MIGRGAIFPVAQRAFRYATTGMGGGALVGAGVGSAVGVGSAAAQGGDARDMLRRGIAGGVGGAALGTGAGFAGRQLRDTRLLNQNINPRAVLGQTMKRIGGEVRDFGKRQLHGLTGRGDPRQMGFDSVAKATKQKELLSLRHTDDVMHGGKAVNKKSLDAHDAALKTLTEHGERGERAINAGITNLPGLAKGVVKDPRGTAKALWESNMGGGALGMGLGVGIPAAASVPELLRGDESAAGGYTKKRKLLNLGADLGVGVATAGLPILPAAAAGLGVDALLKRRRPVRDAIQREALEFAGQEKA